MKNKFHKILFVSKLQIQDIWSKEDFGQRLKRIRKDRGFTQVELSQKLDIPQHLISSYEIGRARPQYEALVKFAAILDTSVDELVGLKKPQQSSDLESNLLKRMKNIQKLPAAQKSALLKTIDMFLKAANVTTQG